MAANGFIQNTNIIVDNFQHAKKFAPGKFIHFISHFHSDHYWGLTTA
jgi:metal-dependent hydrolase (beta-lactamase superfamily II)